MERAERSWKLETRVGSLSKELAKQCYTTHIKPCPKPFITVTLSIFANSSCWHSLPALVTVHMAVISSSYLLCTGFMISSKALE